MNVLELFLKALEEGKMPAINYTKDPNADITLAKNGILDTGFLPAVMNGETFFIPILNKDGSLMEGIEYQSDWNVLTVGQALLPNHIYDKIVKSQAHQQVIIVSSTEQETTVFKTPEIVTEVNPGLIQINPEDLMRNAMTELLKIQGTIKGTPTSMVGSIVSPLMGSNVKEVMKMFIAFANASNYKGNPEQIDENYYIAHHLINVIAQDALQLIMSNLKVFMENHVSLEYLTSLINFLKGSELMNQILPAIAQGDMENLRKDKLEYFSEQLIDFAQEAKTQRDDKEYQKRLQLIATALPFNSGHLGVPNKQRKINNMVHVRPKTSPTIEREKYLKNLIGAFKTVGAGKGVLANTSDESYNTFVKLKNLF